MYSILIWLTVGAPVCHVSVPGPGVGAEGKIIWMFTLAYVIVDARMTRSVP